MERLIIILVSIGLALLDNSVIPFLSINKSYPSLLFTFIVGYSLLNKRENCIFIGLVSGIIQDIFFFNGFGVNCLLNLILCYLSSVVGEMIIREKRLIPVIFVGILTIVKSIFIFVIFYFINIRSYVSNSIVSAIYNGIIMFLTYKYFIRIYDDDYKKQRWRFK